MADEEVVQGPTEEEKEELRQESRDRLDFARFRRQTMERINPWSVMTDRGGWRSVVGGLLQGLISPQASRQATAASMELFKMEKNLEEMKEAQKIRKQQIDLQRRQVDANLQMAEIQRQDAMQKLKAISELYPTMSRDEKMGYVGAAQPPGFMDRVLQDPVKFEKYKELQAAGNPWADAFGDIGGALGGDEVDGLEETPPARSLSEMAAGFREGHPILSGAADYASMIHPGYLPTTQFVLPGLQRVLEAIRRRGSEDPVVAPPEATAPETATTSPKPDASKPRSSWINTPIADLVRGK